MVLKADREYDRPRKESELKGDVNIRRDKPIREERLKDEKQKYEKKR